MLIVQDLAIYTPLLYGIILLGISLPDSDLDIIYEVADFPSFEYHSTRHYAHLPEFSLSYKRTSTNLSECLPYHFSRAGIFTKLSPVTLT